MNIQIEVSDSILQKYNLADASQVEHVICIGLQQIRIEEALAMYRRGLVSLWKAATMAGIPLREMMAQASARGYEPEVDDEMLAEELR
jgi:predicted HTH domain antitoxin